MSLFVLLAPALNGPKEEITKAAWAVPVSAEIRPKTINDLKLASIENTKVI